VKRLGAAIATALTLLASPALAQTACNIPPAISVPPAPRVRADEVVRNVPVAYYVLALSWSPEWCRTRTSSRYDTLQCRDNRFSWVLHGLWPNGVGSRHPAYCAEPTALPAATLRKYLCATPSASLLTHEWNEHGACGWKSPDAFFTQSTGLFNALKRPSPARAKTAGDVRTAFSAANPGFPRNGIFVGTQSGRLSEVRVCYDLKFAPRACPQRGAPDSVALQVTPS
jgi:ribonuclease T2